jgi:hypothetical protein
MNTQTEQAVNAVLHRADPFIFLARVKLHLCDRVMDACDVKAFWLIDAAQTAILKEPANISGSDWWRFLNPGKCEEAE